jgi:hypothetical protein
VSVCGTIVAVLGLSADPTRKDVLTFISKAAIYGNLGAFIGAGFSKAVLNNGGVDIALSWGELLERASAALDVNYKEISKVGVGYPDIASAICKAHSDKVGGKYEDSLSKLKRQIAALTAWYPDQTKRLAFAKYLQTLSPAWIITTNYDLVIESLLTGASTPLGPNDSLSSPKGVIPVFHLHGIRTNPEEIIIAQEDYVALFRPSEYRQIKLALTVKESTTLILGYGLGDVNVLTALDWSRNVFSAKQKNYPSGVIQVLRKGHPVKAPYRDHNDIVIIETESLSAFFEQFAEVHEGLLKREEKNQEALTSLAATLNNPKHSTIDKFIDDSNYRQKMLRIISKFSLSLSSGFISFLSKCIDETWSRSAPIGKFEGYNENLIILLDILTSFPVGQCPPALFQTAAYGLERVAGYVGKEKGQSWAAKDAWERRKKDLNMEMIQELKHFAQQHGYWSLSLLIGDS